MANSHTAREFHRRGGQGSRGRDSTKWEIVELNNNGAESEKFRVAHDAKLAQVSEGQWECAQ